MAKEKRKYERRKFGYYMRVRDDNTYEKVGYLSDVSEKGFKLECQKALKVKKDYALRLEITQDIGNQVYIVLVARALWSQPDPITPNEFVEGFKIVSMSANDEEIYQRIVERYGKPAGND